MTNVFVTPDEWAESSRAPSIATPILRKGKHWYAYASSLNVHTLSWLPAETLGRVRLVPRIDKSCFSYRFHPNGLNGLENARCRSLRSRAAAHDLSGALLTRVNDLESSAGGFGQTSGKLVTPQLTRLAMKS